MQISKLLTVSALFFILYKNSFAQEYDIERQHDGPFSFSIQGVQVNEGSTLQRESILFNDPTSPITLLSHSINFSYADRAFRFNGTTELKVDTSIVALELRTSLYDVFGQHMRNLSNTEAKDFAIGTVTLDGVWRARENDITELLTAVTYVARVRFADGTQWIFNSDNLILALSNLNLEQEFEDESGLD